MQSFFLSSNRSSQRFLMIDALSITGIFDGVFKNRDHAVGYFDVFFRHPFTIQPTTHLCQT